MLSIFLGMEEDKALFFVVLQFTCREGFNLACKTIKRAFYPQGDD
jgi:hypothetical protein